MNLDRWKKNLKVHPSLARYLSSFSQIQPYFFLPITFFFFFHIVSAIFFQKAIYIISQEFVYILNLI